MEANQTSAVAEAAVVDTQVIDATRDLEVLRELSALELSLVGGGQGTVSFM